MALDKYFGIKEFSIPFRSGRAGVEFFFVLSGFIIVWVHLQDFGHPERLFTYLRKRAVRIFPTYWIIFLGVYVLAYLSEELRQNLPQGMGAVSTALFLAPQNPAVVGGTGAPVLIVAWTLQYEILFYALIALFILNRVLGSVIAIGLFVNCVCSGFVELQFPLSFLANSLMLLFGLGAIVAVVSKSAFKLKRPIFVAIVGILGFIITCVSETLIGGYVVDTIDTHMTLRHLLYGVFSTLIILGLVQMETQSRLRVQMKGLCLLGDASYALYLIHFPLISVLCKLSMLIGLHGILGAAIAYPLILCTCIVTSVVFHIVVEQRILKFFAMSKSRVIATASGTN